jgi:ribonuclease J
LTPAQKASTRVLFLGGLGEIGRNMLCLEAQGRLLVLECGLSFPTEEMLGVDLVLPDYSYVRERASACDGVVLTHGHEDHVGALSWFLRDVEVPVYGTPLTLGIARRRLDEFGVAADFRQVSDFDRLSLGPFDCSFLAVSHSIPDSVALVVDSPGGRILYTGDFKFDDAPIDGRKTDVEGFARTGREGVDLMLSDSTNALSPGRTPSESVVGERLQAVFASAPRRIIVACFASNLHRIQQVCSAAEASGRRVAFVGRSMIANAEVGRELGHLDVADETLVPIEELDGLAPESTVVICTGSQGEPLSALSLIASREHRQVRVEPDDVVVLSASAIPGNESAVHRVINELYRSGASRARFTSRAMPRPTSSPS